MNYLPSSPRNRPHPQSINIACAPEGLEDARLEKSFDVWWPELERQLNEIQEAAAILQIQPVPVVPLPSELTSRVLEEILELTRNNHKLLRDPAALLPADYMQHVLRRTPRRDESGVEIRGFEGRIHPDALKEIVEIYRETLKFFGHVKADLEPHPGYAEMHSLLRRMDAPLRYISREMGLRLPREALGGKDEF